MFIPEYLIFSFSENRILLYISFIKLLKFRNRKYNFISKCSILSFFFFEKKSNKHISIIPHPCRNLIILPCPKQNLRNKEVDPINISKSRESLCRSNAVGYVSSRNKQMEEEKYECLSACTLA